MVRALTAACCITRSTRSSLSITIYMDTRQSYGIPRPDPVRCKGVAVDILAQPRGSSRISSTACGELESPAVPGAGEVQFVPPKIARDLSSAFPMHVSACQAVAATVGHITKIWLQILDIEWIKCIVELHAPFLFASMMQHDIDCSCSTASNRRPWMVGFCYC